MEAPRPISVITSRRVVQAMLVREIAASAALARQHGLLMAWGLGCGMLFPLSFSGSLAAIAPAGLWIIWLLGGQLVVDAVWASDWRNGFCHHMVAQNMHAELAVAKFLMAVVLVLVTLMLASPILLAMFAVPAARWGAYILALATGMIGYMALGHVIAILVLGIRRAAHLIGLLMFPLLVPLIIFGADFMVAPSLEVWAILAGYSLFLTILALVLVPFGLRLAVNHA